MPYLENNIILRQCMPTADATARACRVVAAGAENGWVRERGVIWDPDGRAAAVSRQAAVVFD